MLLVDPHWFHGFSADPGPVPDPENVIAEKIQFFKNKEFQVFFILGLAGEAFSSHKRTFLQLKH